MKTSGRIGSTAAALLVLVNLAGCGVTGRVRDAARNAQVGQQLRLMAISYLEFHEVNHRGPSGPDEWLKSPSGRGDELTPLIEKTRPGGTFVFSWNVHLQDLSTKSPGRSNTVLGYESKTPEEGGLVVMADGAVRTLTPEEFRSAAKPPENAKK